MDDIFDFDALHSEFCSLVLDRLEERKTDEEIGFLFNRHNGLCWNFSSFLQNHDLIIGVFAREKLHDKLYNLFGESNVPFNKIGGNTKLNMLDYYTERDEGKLYENPKRLAHLHKYARRTS